MVTGQLLPLRQSGGGGLYPDRNGKLQYLEKRLPHGIFVLLTAQLATVTVYRDLTKLYLSS